MSDSSELDKTASAEHGSAVSGRNAESFQRVYGKHRHIIAVEALNLPAFPAQRLEIRFADGRAADPLLALAALG